MSCARPPSCLTTNLVRSLSHVRPGENTRSEETRGHRAFASSAGLLPQKHTPPSQATATERKASGATQLTHFPSPPVKKAPLRFQSLLRPITPSKVKNYCPISLAPPATPRLPHSAPATPGPPVSLPPVYKYAIPSCLSPSPSSLASFPPRSSHRIDRRSSSGNGAICDADEVGVPAALRSPLRPPLLR